jgi:hypothetical protein
MKKTEPKSRAVSVDRVANIGIKQVRTRPPSPLMKGPGFKASLAGKARHPTGSQGKH